MKARAESFLVINPFGIGDVLYSTPLLRALSNAFPGCRIYYMCNRRTEPVLRSHPLVAGTFIYHRSEFVEAEKKSLLCALGKYNKFISEIRRARISVSLDLSLGTPFSLFSLLAGIPCRLGLDHKGRGRFLTRRVRINGFKDKHVAEHYLDVLRLMGVESPRHQGLEITVAEKESRRAAEFAAGLGKPLIGIAPCGGEAFGKDAEVKRWPAENFSMLIARLAERHPQGKILVFAGPGEETTARSIIACSGATGACVPVIGQPLEDAVALIARCDCFIGNDTGLVRCAEALGGKAVLIFGIADERVYGPYGGNGSRVALLKKDIPCRPCYRDFRLPRCERGKECLTSIRVDEVFDAAEGFLRENA